MLVIIAAGLITYSNTFHAPFQKDEGVYIRENPFVHDMTRLDRSAQTDTEVYKSVIQRYVGYVTFALNYRLHGLRVEGYHAVNVTVHILNALLLYLIVSLTFRTPRLQDSAFGEYAPSLGLFTALFFAVHPIQTEAVTYIMQRLAVLAAFFSLAAMTFYVQWRLSGEGPGKDRILFSGQAWRYWASVIAAVLAMKTKEIAFTLPLVLAAYELLFFHGDVRKRLLRLLPLIMTMAIIPLSTFILLREIGMTVSELLVGGNAEPLPWSSYLITQSRVVVTYLRLLIVPINQNFHYDYPVYDTILDPQVLVSILLHLGLILLSVSLVRRSKNGEPALRVVAFGIILFYAALAVESSVLPLPHVICEYRAYLPAAGFLLSALTGIMILAARKRRHTGPRYVLFMLSVLAVSASAASYARNGLWNDKISLWKDSVAQSPRSAASRGGLAIAYEEAGLHEDAIDEYQKALAADPNYHQARFNLIMALFDRDRIAEAVDWYRNSRSIILDDATALSQVERLAALCRQDRAEEAYREFRETAGNALELAEMHFQNALTCEAWRRYSDAVGELETALQLDPGHIEARHHLGWVFFQAGRPQDAVREVQTVLRLDPGHLAARRTMQVLSEAEKMHRTPN